MQIIPELFLEKIKTEKLLNKAIIDIDLKIEELIKNQAPIFFPEYTDHGIDHFANTLKMALHLVDVEQLDKERGIKPVIDYLTSLDITTIVYSVLLHDLGMHIHFKGFKQLISGFYDDIRIDFLDEFKWSTEWDNFMVIAKRFSGRERINIFGDEQVIINEVDFNKDTVDSDIQKILIGEFIRRNHGRLAHEIAIKGFPLQGEEVIEIAEGLTDELKDIIGLIARSHNMNVRDAMEYISFKYPSDPSFPQGIEVPFIMCLLRIADYFQFDKSRTNMFLIKLKSFNSPFSLNEHRTHLATEYFKTDDKDPETLFVNLKPRDGIMYNKLTRLFDDIQRELDTAFAVNGEMYARHKPHLRLRYRRVKTNLKNKVEISRLPYVVGSHKFEADTDLFKLLVGPLYGYEESFGVRELLQNAIDACIELNHKKDSYFPIIDIHISEFDGNYYFIIKDNGKGMNVSEIKNYFLKAGSSFRNSTEWKIEYQKNDNSPAIRRTGKFGIGVLAAFLIGSSIQVTTRRFNEQGGYKFDADLNKEFIEILKEEVCDVGTTIKIKITSELFQKFRKDTSIITKWYKLSYPVVNYYIDDQKLENKEPKITLKSDIQYLEDSVRIAFKDFDDIIWRYDGSKDDENHIAINGIKIPESYAPDRYNIIKRMKKDNPYEGLDNYPFVSVLDRNNIIDLELNRNSIRGQLTFLKDLKESCQLDYLYKLLFYNPPVKENVIDFTNCEYSNDGYKLAIKTKQFSTDDIFTTNKGYFLNNVFYNPVKKGLNHFNIFVNDHRLKKINIFDKSTYSLFRDLSGVYAEKSLIRGNYKSYITISKPAIFFNHHKSNTITKSVREYLEIVEQTKEYVIFKFGDINRNCIDNLKELFFQNNAVAVQLTSKSFSEATSVNSLLKVHFHEAKLIPIEYDEKIAYIRTLSQALQSHIVEKRGIKI